MADMHRQMLPRSDSLMRIGIGAARSACSAILAMMILPLPPVVLDVLFTFNIALSLVDPDGGVLRRAAARVRRLPDRAAARHVAAPGAERRLDARRAAARPRPARTRPARSSRPSASSSSAATTPSASSCSSSSPSSTSSSSPRAPAASRKCPRASPWTPCPASRWRSTPT